MPRVPTSPAPCRIAMPPASGAPRPASRRAKCSRRRRRPTCCSAASSPGPMASGADALRALGGSSFVVAATPYADETLKSVAHVLLPISTFVETSGTYVNLEGLWQSFAGAAKPLGEARPGWKVLRVLGNLAGVANFDYQSSEEVREELRVRCADIAARSYEGTSRSEGRRRRGAQSEARVVDVPMYAIDAVLRRAPSLQRTREGKLAPPCLRRRRAHDATWLGNLVALSGLAGVPEVDVLDPRGDRHAHPLRGVHHAVGTQGHRLDAAAQGSEPRGQHLRLRARHLSALRRRHQAAHQGSGHSQRTPTRCCSTSRPSSR